MRKAIALALLALPLSSPAAIERMGVINPEITQDNIHQTICVPGWTRTVRPPTSYTDRVKRDVLPEGTDISRYEGDHILPLALGGAPKNSETEINIVPQPWDDKCGARQKDVAETWLHREVCKGEITLDVARKYFMPWKCDE